MRTRDWRRFQARRVQRKRIKKWTTGNFSIGKEKHKGMMKKTHFGCGCPMCKPWKHRLGQRYKPSERRKLQREE